MGGVDVQGVDDVWEQGSDSGDPNVELDRDTRCRKEKLYNDGFREGIDQGKDTWAQEGFDEGFKRGMDAGIHWGMARGAVVTLNATYSAPGNEIGKNQIDFLTNQINIQENEAAISIYNDLVAKYDNKVLVELQSAGSTFQPSQEEVQPARLPSNTSTNATEIAKKVLNELAKLGCNTKRL